MSTTVGADTLVRFLAQFDGSSAPAAYDTDPTYSAADPTAVTCTLTDPAGTATTYTYGTDPELTKQATGYYTCEVVLDSEGLWRYAWTGTGTVQAGNDGTVTVVEGD